MEQPSSAQYNTRIREIPSSERPRERLRDRGAGVLNTAELLAIILRSGFAEQNVLALAMSLLSKHNGLAGLARLSFAELVREKGIGPAKAAELLAVFQLARQLSALQPQERPYVRAPQDVHLLLGAEMAMLDQEHLRVILLSTRNQVMAVSEVYIGNVSSAVIRTAEVFREAIRQNAPSLVVVHNHPSGDPSPSPEDVNMTKQLIDAGKLMQIEVLDHIILGIKPPFVSLKQLGLAFGS